jgi:hypothetical protein
MQLLLRKIKEEKLPKNINNKVNDSQEKYYNYDLID